MIIKTDRERPRLETLAHNFTQEMAALRKRHAQNPQRELHELLLMALEREELVAVAYRDRTLESSIGKLEIPEATKDLLRSALVWIWKDEQMHTTYVRSVILQTARRMARWEILMVQAAGSIGGWSSSVLHHNDWKSAPVARLMAKTALLLGSVAGKVPVGVLEKLKNQSFHDFCKFNIEAEITAEICWRRITELATELRLQPHHIQAFHQIAKDEDNHRRVFTILSEAERLTTEEIVERIGAVGKYFLPRKLRHDTASVKNTAEESVWCFQADTSWEKLRLFRRLLTESGLAHKISARARSLGKPAAKMRVAIKAPFMMVYDKSDLSPALDSELLSELVLYLRENGISEIALLERGNIYEKFQDNRSVFAVASYLGLDQLPVRLVDCKDDQIPYAYPRGLGLSTISETWKDADFRVTFGKLRSHPSDQAILTVSNMEGLGPRWDDFLFFERSVDFASAQATMVSEFPPDFALLDAFEKTPDGMIGVMGHPKAQSIRRLYASADAVALDLTVLRHLGANPQESSVLRELLYWRGDRSVDTNGLATKVQGTDVAIQNWRGPHSNDFCEFLSLFSLLFYEYTGRGRLFVPRFDRSAFPPLESEGLILRLLRQTVRLVISLQFLGRSR